jgi:hypothetical protein
MKQSKRSLGSASSSARSPISVARGFDSSACRMSLCVTRPPPYSRV